MQEFWQFPGRAADSPAILDGRSPAITYGTLSGMADAWAGRIAAVAAGRRPLVVLEFATTPEAIAAYLGVLRAGFPLLLTEPGRIGAGSPLAETWYPDLHLRAEAGGGLVLVERPGWRERAAVLPAPHPDLRLLLSTSGSTGEPKLVRLSGANIAANATAIADYLGIRPDDRAATTLPLFYSYGLSVLNSYLSAGAALVLTPQPVTEPAFWDAARAGGVTSLALVPHQFDLLEGIGFSGRELPRLRYVTQAGGRLDPATVRRFHVWGRAAGWQLVLMYGQTEAAPRISYVPPDALPGAADTIGRAIPGGRLWLADETGAAIGTPGRAGELVYEGPNVMMGYARARADLAQGAGPRVLHTGDIAERTADGFFRIVGRSRRFVKLFGLRLGLDRIEALLRDRGIAADAVAVEDRLVLLHAAAGQGEAARQAVAAACGLPVAAIHAGHLPERPLLSPGKPDLQALARIAAGVIREAEAERQRSRGQTGLAEVLRQATRRAAVGPSDSFASLGGDSLSYLQMQMALEERLGAAPRGWEDMPLSQLEALTPAPTAAPGAAAAPQMRVGMDVLLRLAAIGLVVAQHATDYPVHGGTWILILLVGFSLARFQMRQIAGGQAGRIVLHMLYPVVPLYALILAAYGLLRRPVPPENLLLVANYAPPRGTLLEVYWFVSLYAQIVLVVALAAAVPGLRRALATRPWGAGAAATAGLAGIMALVVVPAGGPVGGGLPYVPQRGLIEGLSLVGLGWMLQHMAGGRQVAATLLLAAVVLADLALLGMAAGPLALLAAALVLLAAGPGATLPRPLARAANRLAAVTLHVYLLHQVVVHVLRMAELPQPVTLCLALALSFAAGLLSHALFERLDRFGRRHLARPRQIAPVPVPERPSD